MRVGRAAIDEDAIRLIEEHHPDIQFDWPQILRGAEETPVPEREEVGRREDVSRRPQRPPREAPPQAPLHEAAAFESAASSEPDVGVPSVAEPAPVDVTEPVSPAHARLGSEALARLRGRYADVLANLARRVPDEQRRQQLREQAEGLNPDNWVTDGEVTAGLDAYESVLASLREVVGRRRRRRRGRGSSGQGTPQGAAGGTADSGEGAEAADTDLASAEPREDGPADDGLSDD